MTSSASRSRKQVMNYLQPDHVAEIERILGGRLTPELVAPATKPDALSPAAVDVIRKIAKQSKQLAVAYLREVVPSERLSLLVSYLEKTVAAE